jgi:preprotein translocase subunit SecE
VAETKVEKAEKKGGLLKKMAEERREQPAKPNALVVYLRETRGELRKVTWPTREEAQRLTAIVLGVTFLMALFLGALDFLFSTGVKSLVEFMAGI